MASLPDGKYTIRLFGLDITTVDGVEVIAGTVLEYITLSQEQVNNLKVGDVIDADGPYEEVVIGSIVDVEDRMPDPNEARNIIQLGAIMDSCLSWSTYTGQWRLYTGYTPVAYYRFGETLYCAVDDNALIENDSISTGGSDEGILDTMGEFFISELYYDVNVIIEGGKLTYAFFPFVS